MEERKMITVGQYSNVKVSKKVDFGYYLKDRFGDEVLLQIPFNILGILCNN